MNTKRHRRHLLLRAAAGAASLAAPGLLHAQRHSGLPSMTEGPFYPSAAWRQAQGGAADPPDWDADLTQTRRGGITRTARGEHLGLELALADERGQPIDRAEVEIWQCDALGAYRHPRVRLSDEQVDAGFQGFGAATTDARGQVAFRTIRPVVYPGRTPHIHIRLRHSAVGELTSQLFVAGEPANARDFLWQQLKPAQQVAAAMALLPATTAAAAATGQGLRWRVRHVIVLA